MGELISGRVRLQLLSGIIDMADNQLLDSQLRAENCLWSNRILSVALAGIFFFTLYPFHFSPRLNLAEPRSPFFLVSGGKTSGPLNAFLNILLFVPFGFGLAAKLREKGKSGAKILLLIMLAGALLSYCIEFLQIYIPTRDSGWEDMFTNATGAAVGYFLFEVAGTLILRLISAIENRVESFSTLRRALSILFLYFVAWLAVSASLQADSKLKNWTPDSRLVIGNDAAGHLTRRWKGNMSSVQFWNRAMPSNIATEITSGKSIPEGMSKPLAAFVFSNNPLLEDENHFISKLIWTPNTPDVSDGNALTLNGSSWMISQADVGNLIQALQKTNNFSLRVVCTPAEVRGADGRIVSISQQDGSANLSLLQRDSNLIFWFRNPLSVRRDQLILNIPDVFVLNEPRDILVSYDGSNLSVYIKGKREPRMYELTPGAPLAQTIRHIKTNELEGYTYIYYALVFFPAGVLLGFLARRMTGLKVRKLLLMATVIVLPPVFLEILLVHVSGREFSLGNICLSILFGFFGLKWLEADRQRPAVIPAAAPHHSS